MKKNALCILILQITLFFSGCDYEDVDQSNENIASSDDTTEILEQLRLADSFTNKFPDSVLFHANKALKLSEEKKYERGINFSNYYLGTAEWSKGNYLEAIAFYKRTLEHTTDSSLKAISLRDISLSLIYIDKTEEAKEYLDESIILFKKLNDLYGLTLAYINYGMIESGNENFLKALTHYQEALKLTNETNSPLNKSLILNNLGVINEKLEMKLIALNNYQQALEITNELGRAHLSALYINNIANIYIEQEKYEEALQFIEKGLAISEESGDKRTIIFLITSKGKAYLKTSNFDLAIECYNQAFNLAEEIGIIDNILDIKIGLGTAYFQKGDFNEALTILTTTIREAEKSDNKKIIKEASEIKAKIHYSKSEFKKAYTCIKLSNEMADSLSKSKIVKQFTQMEMQYEFDEKQHKADLNQQKINLENNQRLERQKLLLIFLISGFIIIVPLLFIIFRNYRHKQNLYLQLGRNFNRIKDQKQVIEDNNTDLKELNATKDKLFSIIAHDLTSPFNIILGFSEQLSAQYDKMDEAKRKHYVEEINISSNKAYKLLKNLLTWSRSQGGGIEINKTNHQLSKFIKESIEVYLPLAIRKNLTVNNEIPEDIMVSADELTMKAVFGNLFNNAIKFTHKGGSITFTAKSHVHYTEISVEDTGVGIPRNKINKLFKVSKNISTVGTNNEKGTGLGLVISHDFVSKNDGVLNVVSRSGKGSKFTIVLPR